MGEHKVSTQMVRQTMLYSSFPNLCSPKVTFITVW